MPVIDPVHFMYERNYFPSLTDKEFETLILYCQMMNVQMVADYQNRNPDVIIKHLKSCKKKTGVESDFELYFVVINKFVNFEKAFPELTLQQINVLAAFSFYPKRSSIARRYGVYRRDIYDELVKIRNNLGINDLNSLRMFFFMRITLFS
ncbi:helix-turn-helix domain-containing protein [Salmonella enterica]|uniref:Helix-turn-helix domain-containing protein n=1 Tax=Salmonella enterica subsp. houtenae serovar 48:z4,z32:- TaxID=2577535 RepID=A0A729FWG5_SALHO|nr:helix-turn-helix transcriptional regulator [Salmonella enterica subsp. houtenae]EAQ6168830.1 helix-turn-helix transcriptional regulator [Salmonella enterica]EDV7107379.1 helix-turn-helix domain-containing protein [Salmonella enterica subsp. enterica]EKR1448438.1 helix-turn-helix domain-containing protein [Salmonella enterica subsp. houtenae serovar 48:z4,z32:-]EBM4324349.1 helix-turn-helix transcriptional regulator [Salmonella enterica]